MSELNSSFGADYGKHRSRQNWDNQIHAKQWGKFSLLSQLLFIQAGFNLDQESISCLNGLEPEAKAANGWSAWGEGEEA